MATSSTSKYSPTCDPCDDGCDIPYPPTCIRSTEFITESITESYTNYVTDTTIATYSFINTFISTTTRHVTSITISESNNDAIIGTSVPLAIIGGVLFPLSIALIFYYRRHEKKRLVQQNTDETATQLKGS